MTGCINKLNVFTKQHILNKLKVYNIYRSHLLRMSVRFSFFFFFTIHKNRKANKIIQLTIKCLLIYIL